MAVIYISVQTTVSANAALRVVDAADGFPYFSHAKMAIYSWPKINRYNDKQSIRAGRGYPYQPQHIFCFEHAAMTDVRMGVRMDMIARRAANRPTYECVSNSKNNLQKRKA